MSLAEQGEEGYAATIDHQAAMADLLRARLLASGWRVVNQTPLPLVCFTRPGLNPSALLAALREQQVAWMSELELDGEPVMRACITSFRTTADDVEQVVEAMNSLVSGMDRKPEELHSTKAARGAAPSPAERLVQV